MGEGEPLKRPPRPPITSARDLYEYDRLCDPTNADGSARKPWHLTSPAVRLTWERTYRPDE